MALILNILLSIISVGMFSGRLYELINLTDLQTGFLKFNGIVFNPYILPIFVVITICCGVLILGDIKAGKNFFAKSAGIFSVFAGFSFLAHIVATVVVGNVAPDKHFNQLSFFIMLGAFGFIGLGILGLHGKKYEMVIVTLLTAFCVGLCLNTIVLDVTTIYNINFLKASFSTISVIMFLLMIFKNVYRPSRSSIMWLYISGFICFVFSGIMYLADIAYGYLSLSIAVSDLFLYSGYVFIGLYAVSTAILAIPNGRIEVSIKPCEPEAWNSIKMLAQTQEIKIKDKINLSGIALIEKEHKTQNTNMSKKTATYRIAPKFIENQLEAKAREENPVKEKLVKEKSVKEKSVKEKPVKEKPIKEKKTIEKQIREIAAIENPIKVENKAFFKTEDKKPTSSKEKVVYKRPQD